MVRQTLAGEGPRRPDGPTQRHPGAEPDPFNAYLIHQPPQKPQTPPASAQLMGVGIGSDAGRGLRAMMQDRRLNPVVVDVDHDLDRLLPA